MFGAFGLFLPSKKEAYPKTEFSAGFIAGPGAIAASMKKKKQQTEKKSWQTDPKKIEVTRIAIDFSKIAASKDRVFVVLMYIYSNES